MTSSSEEQEQIIREAIGNDLGLVERVEPDAALDTLLTAFRYACTELATRRELMSGDTYAPASEWQVDDVVEEFLGKARGVGA